MCFFFFVGDFRFYFEEGISLELWNINYKRKKKLEKGEPSAKKLEQYEQKLSQGTLVTDISEVILIQMIEASQLCGWGKMWML